MSLESSTGLGVGGAGLHDRLPKVLKELQGLTISTVAGAAANTKINLAALRSEDTIIGATKVASGVPSDVLGTLTVEDLRASGTLTLSGVVAADTAVVNGKTYTFKASADPLKLEVTVGGTDTITATNLKNKINQVEANGSVVASSSGAVVTIKAKLEGTAGNSIALGSTTHVTRSGATLSGGTTTGGFKLSGDSTGAVIQLVWFNKNY
jgi:hypothetical protein